MPQRSGQHSEHMKIICLKGRFLVGIWKLYLKKASGAGILIMQFIKIQLIQPMSIKWTTHAKKMINHETASRWVTEIRGLDGTEIDLGMVDNRNWTVLARDCYQ